jgi:hypothetical protein
MLKDHRLNPPMEQSDRSPTSGPARELSTYMLSTALRMSVCDCVASRWPISVGHSSAGWLPIISGELFCSRRTLPGKLSRMQVLYACYAAWLASERIMCCSSAGAVGATATSTVAGCCSCQLAQTDSSVQQDKLVYHLTADDAALLYHAVAFNHRTI